MNNTNAMTKYFTEMDLKEIDTATALNYFSLEKDEALLEIITYITNLVGSYSNTTNTAIFILKSSTLLKSLFNESQFSEEEINFYKHKVSKLKSKINVIKGKEKIKNRVSYLAKSLKALDKIVYKQDLSERRIFNTLKKYIDEMISIDFICETIDKYSNCMCETKNGITIYDYLITKFLDTFPIEKHTYEPHYYLNCLKCLKKKCVITLTNIDSRINKLKTDKLTDREKALLLEFECLINNESFDFSQDHVDKKYEREQIKTSDQKLIIESPYILGTYSNVSRLPLTIDPSLASLKDDAVSIVKDGSNYIFGIHVTAACEQIKEDSLIDRIAKQNHKTIYEGSKKAVDMIDPRLANSLFSLEAGKIKPCLSLYVVMSNSGEIKEHYFKFEELSIAKNLTYENADDTLNKSDDKDLQKILFDLTNIADSLKEQNNSDVYRKIKSIIRGNNFDDYTYSTHSLIEEAMVLYNHLLSLEFKDTELPFIYRVHSKPTLEELNGIVKNISHPNEQIFCVSKDDLTRLIKEFYPKAEYSPINIGHFGLGLDSYCHVTSPGRRYPDLFTQKLYKDLIYKNPTLEDVKKYKELVEEYTKMFNFQSETQDDYYKDLSLLKKRN